MTDVEKTVCDDLENESERGDESNVRFDILYKSIFAPSWMACALILFSLILPTYEGCVVNPDPKIGPDPFYKASLLALPFSLMTEKLSNVVFPIARACWILFPHYLACSLIVLLAIAIRGDYEKALKVTNRLLGLSLLLNATIGLLYSIYVFVFGGKISSVQEFTLILNVFLGSAAILLTLCLTWWKPHPLRFKVLWFMASLFAWLGALWIHPWLSLAGDFLIGGYIELAGLNILLLASILHLLTANTNQNREQCPTGIQVSIRQFFLMTFICSIIVMICAVNPLIKSGITDLTSTNLPVRQQQQ